MNTNVHTSYKSEKKQTLQDREHLCKHKPWSHQQFIHLNLSPTYLDQHHDAYSIIKKMFAFQGGHLPSDEGCKIKASHCPPPISVLQSHNINQDLKRTVF